MLDARSVAEDVGNIIAPYIKEWSEDGPEFRKNLSSEEIEPLFDQLYKLVKNILMEDRY
jgi:hypothetical protein